MNADRRQEQARVTTGRSRLLPLVGLAALSGALLFLSDFPVHAWPLQAAALLPLIFGLERCCRSSAAAALAGLALGAVFSGPLLWVLEFPLLMGLPLALYQTAVWVLAAVGAHLVLRWPGAAGALAVGAVAVLLEWAEFTLLPVWGTAQCFARVWTATPLTVQLVSLTGVTGLVLVLVAGQALLVRLATAPGRRRGVALGLALLLGGAGVWSALAWRAAPTGGTLRVAAVGWTSDLSRPPRPAEETYRVRWRPLVEEAVARGARLVVSPEVGFWLGGAQRRDFLARFAALARTHGVALVVGYFDEEARVNRAALFDERGVRRAEYEKTHLIPFVERYHAGRGELTVLPLAGGATLGAMICQDDNFTDLGRAYGQRAVALVAVPTNDWRQVKDYHLENALFRAVENRYAVVRAATNGISAIVSPRGEVLARRDHVTAGAGQVVADVALHPGPTPYARWGDWLPALCALGLCGGLFVSWRRRRPRR